MLLYRIRTIIINTRQIYTAKTRLVLIPTTYTNETNKFEMHTEAAKIRTHDL